ncbi:hypothetical protein PSHT_14021 [Puccinia striiformis]|uniref:Uncharacterized protein n=1 Tax=Puccinia striiformis TaxID=27350 RepID=A0A2S4UMB5_9BASI|nr:hypothetical protein PSHT_14021 [Puccinia striiformis]
MTLLIPARPAPAPLPLPLRTPHLSGQSQRTLTPQVPNLVPPGPPLFFVSKVVAVGFGYKPTTNDKSPNFVVFLADPISATRHWRGALFKHTQRYIRSNPAKSTNVKLQSRGCDHQPPVTSIPKQIARSHLQNPPASLATSVANYQPNMELMAPSDADCTPVSVPSGSTPARHRKIPSHLVLSLPSTFLNCSYHVVVELLSVQNRCFTHHRDDPQEQGSMMTQTIIHRRHLTPRTDYIAPGTQKLDIQLTPPDETHVPSEMMDLTIRDQSTTHSYQDVRRRGSPHHVKMGNRSSCPRTPLRSAGSSSGLTPTIRRWRQSGTESETSVLSSSIPDHIGTDLSHCSDDFDSILSLSFARSITPEPTGKPGSFSTPSTLSLTLAPSPSFASPFPSNLSISFADDDSQALPHSRESSVKSTSAFSNNRSRTAAHAITPSLITEPTKTIQARAHSRDEEQEELQTCVDIGTPPGTINYFADAGGASNSLHSVYNSAENINMYVHFNSRLHHVSAITDHAARTYQHVSFFHYASRNQSGTTRDSSALPSNEELGTLKAADQLNSQQSRGASSKEAPPENSSTRRRSSTILSRPIGFLKMVKRRLTAKLIKYHNPWRQLVNRACEKPSLAQRDLNEVRVYSLIIYQATIRKTSPSRRVEEQVAPPGDRPMFNDTLRSRSETGRSYFSTFHPGKIGQTTEFPRDSQDITADRHNKRGSITHSTPLNIFKFWKKKKNEESAKASPTIAQALEKAGKKRDAKKKTGRHFIKIEQISSPILIGSNDPIPSLSLKTRPLMLSPKLRDDEPNLSRRLTSSESQTLSCSPKSQVNSTKVPQSPGSANRFAHEISTLGPYASNQTLTVQLANHLLERLS